MNEKILKMLQGDESLYPHELEKQYLRVLNKIIELWYTPQAEEYFLDLMVDKRGGRQGFPPKVATEIFRLSQAHERTVISTRHGNDNAWDLAGIRELQVRDTQVAESMNFKFTPEEFFKSIEAGDSTAVSRFLSRNGDLNARDERGWPPLMIAASNGNVEICHLLIQNGADIQTEDNAGYIPLHWAAFNGHSKVVKLLIDNNSDPNARSNFGWTPLMQAATRGHLAAIKNLIAAGADVNLSSNDGWTALHKATANGHTEIVRFLLADGADPNLRHQDGSTALSIATKNNNEAIIALLSGDE